MRRNLFAVLYLLTINVLSVAAQDSIRTSVLDDVVVTGQFEPQSLKQSVYQVRTITYDRIRLRAPVNIQSVLSTELGIRFSNDLTLGTSDISLMGMSGQNVKILLDGVPLLDRGATRESLNQIDVNTVERIEIVDGPMSVVYGTDALAGVINIISKKYGDNKLNVDVRVQEETAAREYEALNGKGVHNENVGIHWQGKRWNVGGNVTRNTFGGWNDDRWVNSESETKWRPKDQWLASGTMGFKTDRLTAWYRLNATTENILFGGFPNVNTGLAVDKEYISDRYNHQFQSDWTITDRLHFNGVASYQDYTRRTRTTIFNTLTGTRNLSPEAGTQDKSMFNTWVARGMFVYKLNDQLSIQPGLDVNLTQGSGERIDRTRTINDYAGFVSVEYKPFTRLQIRPGLRFIHNSAYDAPAAIPSLNAKLALSGSLDWRMSYARGFRSPALRELYFYFFDASHAIRGNPALKAEHSNSFSSSLSWQAPVGQHVRFTSVLTGFYNRFENLIDIGIDPAKPQENTYINVYKYRTVGGTIENNFHWKHLSASIGGSYIGNYNALSEGTQNLPPFLWTPEVNATASYVFNKIGTSISLYYKFTGERNTYEGLVEDDGSIVTSLASRASFHMADLSVSKKINQHIEINGGVRNLFDITNLRNTSGDTGVSHSTGGSVPTAYGRSYFLAVAYHL